ncbi:MAG: acetate--CoA ligase family protein [Syntrophobacterales bacterium]|nr:acetate--CoA ligase family protein [Syntrophobacterales bacterium]
MLKNEIREILEKSKGSGWVLEPDAKNILRLSGIDVPRFTMAASFAEATRFCRGKGYPVAAKVVSPDIMHKSDAGGVVIGINNDDSLFAAFERFRTMKGFTGMLVEEMVSGLEMMAGAKVDSQFGPVILFGMGGTEVELYKDTGIRMAPLQKNDVNSMIKCLKAHPLLEGYRGAPPVNREALTRTLIAFSGLVMEIHEFIESIDLNPLFCSPERCVVGDARFVLK